MRNFQPNEMKEEESDGFAVAERRSDGLPAVGSRTRHLIEESRQITPRRVHPFPYL
jgi:hypothetical protein